jgi:hypothetical protein
MTVMDTSRRIAGQVYHQRPWPCQVALGALAARGYPGDTGELLRNGYVRGGVK